MARKGKGKIKMEKMTKGSNLLVTFFKRRLGLFKKASELCTLCGAEIVLVIFSPNNKVYSFGHPSVETLVDRFLTRNPQTRASTEPVDSQRNATINEVNMELTQVLDELEGETVRGKMLDQMRKVNREKYWLEDSIEELNLEQLEQLKAAMEKLKESVIDEAETLANETSNSYPLLDLLNPLGDALPLDKISPAAPNPNVENSS